MSETGTSIRPEENKCEICGVMFDSKEKLNAHKSNIKSEENPSLSIQTEYDRIAQDWRQIHTVVWGIPNVAVAILTGIVIAAYQSELDGWPRIAVLGAGSVLLFALTVEIVEKRVFMNAISARLYFMEKHNHLEPFNIRKLDVTRELNKYNKAMDRPKSDTDLPYRLFRFSHAREGLTYVVFVSAIILAVLTYWEFIKFIETFDDYAWASYLGIIPIIIICVLLIKYEILGVEGRQKCSNCHHAREFHVIYYEQKNEVCLKDDCNCNEFKNNKNKKRNTKNVKISSKLK